MNQRRAAPQVYRLPPPTNYSALAATILFSIAAVIGFIIDSRRCHELVVWSSNEKYVLLAALEREYAPPDVDRRCVDVTIKKVASGDAESALALDERVEGTRAHVWSPAAITWALLLSEHRKAREVRDLVPPNIGPSLAQSPLVIAMPEKLADTLLECRPDIGWSDILEIARNPQICPKYAALWGRFRLAKTDPTESTSGLHALVSTYNSGVQKPGSLTLEEIGRSYVRAFVGGVESTVVHYGDSVSAFLETLWEEDFRGGALSYVSAIAVEEKQVWEYNRGNPSSLECVKGICPKLPPKEKLKAIYPEEGVLMADHPYIVLDAPWVTDAHRDAAQSFLVHLQRNHERFLDEGFRDAARQGDPDVLRAPLFDASPVPRTLSASAGPVLAEMQASWSELRKRANIIFAFDIGTSIGSDKAGQGVSKLELVKRATIAALPKLTPADAVGLWAFAEREGEAYRELTSLAPLGAGDTFRKSVADLRSGTGGRQLYATVRASVDRLRARFDTERINAVVVLSDGDDDRPGSAEFYALLDYLNHQPEDQRVRVFTIGTAASNPAAESALKQIAQSSKGRTYDATDPLDIAGVLRDVISNF